MDNNNQPATMRALAIALTILETFLLAATTYYIIRANTTGIVIFSILSIIMLFVAAASWGADLDLRNTTNNNESHLSPNEIHDVVEVDYASLLRTSQASALVVTLRPEQPYVTIEGMNPNYNNDWLVDGTSMFEAYVKAWLKTTGTKS